MGYLYLILAIIFEVIATIALKYTEGFTKVIPTLIMVLNYALSFYLFTLVIKTIAIGLAYAIWSGLGIVLVVILSAFLFKEFPDLAAIIGMTLIIAGVGVIHLYSQSVRI